MEQHPIEFTADPAAEGVIADLRRRLDEVGVIADLSTVRHAEAEVLRARLDAVLAARRFEVDVLRRRVAELEARALAGDRGHAMGPRPDDADRPDDPPLAGYAGLAADFQEQLAARTTDLARRYEQRLGDQRAALEEKEDRIRHLTEQLAAIRRELEALRASPDARPADPHDLERISGIGPAIADLLRSLGITTLGQIARLADDELDRIEAHLDAFPGRSRRDRWVEQARALIGADTGIKDRASRADDAGDTTE